MKVIQLLAVLAVVGMPALGRKTYAVKEEYRGRVPQLRASKYPEKELYKNTDDEVVVSYQGKSSIGWEWSQTMTERIDSLPDVYHLNLDIQMKNSLYFSPLISFPRAIYLEPVYELKEFTFGYKLDVAYFWIYPSRENDLLCVSGMFSVSTVKQVGTLVMRLQECYKTLINCIYNLNNWKDETAQYFEKCSQSSKTTITTYYKEREPETFGVYGSAEDKVLRTGTDCNPGTGFWPLAIGDIKQVSYFVNNLGHYMAAKSNFEPGEFDLINLGNRDNTEEL